MSEFIEAAKVGELKDGGMKKVSVGGKDILLARVGGKYYAADNKCPHLGGDLSSGTLEGTVVSCPRHGSQFDLADGRNLLWTDWSGLKQKMANTFKPPRPIATYEVKVEGDALLVAVP